MDYKEKYEMALEGIQEILGSGEDSIKMSRLQLRLQGIFPELKESDDERIKKAIKYGLDYVFTNNTTIYETTKEQCLFWLEKQGKKKSIWHNEDEEPQRGSLILLIMQSGNPIVAKIIEPNYTFNHGERWAYIDDLLDKQGEQKPILDVEIPFGAKDSELKEVTYDIPKGFHAEIEDDKVVIKKGEKSIAWSEEDEAMRKTTILYLENTKDSCVATCVPYIVKCINWLKSLRPQNRWKPSDEQIIELRHVISGCSYDIEPLVELETKLKEL